MSNQRKKIVLEQMIGALELPPSAYEKAQKRYEDLGDWLGRESSIVKDYKPHVFAQGSFRMGTAIRPLDDSEEYDLDLACKLRTGVTKATHTQEILAQMLGDELFKYRTTRGITEPPKKKHRCWRLDYQDELRFHMDVVPCIPADEERRLAIFRALNASYSDEALARAASDLTISITDDRHPRYNQRCDDWQISNPEGYVQWFEYRMKKVEASGIIEAKSQVDRIPLYRRKTVLQRVVQLLKRHRDIMFKDNEDSKPISIIITTLAARAYQGESTIDEALNGILSRMKSFIKATVPRVPNPVDEAEDFADKWSMEKYKHLRLEDNFNAWLVQARIDFEFFENEEYTESIVVHAKNKLGVNMDASRMSEMTGLKHHRISAAAATSIAASSGRPWRR